MTGLLAILSLSAPLGAQRLGDARVAMARAEAGSFASQPLAERTDYGVSSAGMIGTGVLFGAGGLLLGGLIGVGLEDCSGSDDFCGIAGFLIGGTIGEMVLLPMGMHVSGKHSTLGAKMTASVLVALAGIAAAPLTGGVSILAIPPAQLVAITGVEHRAVERNARRRNHQETP